MAHPLTLALCIIVLLALISAIVWFVRVRGRARRTNSELR